MLAWPSICWSEASEPPRSSHWHANVCRVWWTTCVHLRTWLFETTDFYLPDLKIETVHDGSVPENAEAA
jgi:hypothetical protein